MNRRKKWNSNSTLWIEKTFSHLKTTQVEGDQLSRSQVIVVKYPKTRPWFPNRIRMGVDRSRLLVRKDDVIYEQALIFCQQIVRFSRTAPPPFQNTYSQPWLRRKSYATMHAPFFILIFYWLCFFSRQRNACNTRRAFPLAMLFWQHPRCTYGKLEIL